jgi:hypothetical protein
MRVFFDTREGFGPAVAMRCRVCEDFRARCLWRRCVTGVFQGCDKLVAMGETDVLGRRGGVTVLA